MFSTLNALNSNMIYTRHAIPLYGQVLMIGGGGGGNNSGGGAGQAQYASSFSFVPGTTYTITIGQGASGNSNCNVNNTLSNATSTIFVYNSITITAWYGGNGGYNSAGYQSTANVNGCSGGASICGASGTAGTSANPQFSGWVGYANKGSNNYINSPYPSGGSGGISSSPANATSAGPPVGGNGMNFTLNGGYQTGIIGCGGGGSAANDHTKYSLGGSSGALGNNGAYSTTSVGNPTSGGNPGSAPANTGSGGGACWNYAVAGGNGSSGCCWLVVPNSIYTGNLTGIYSTTISGSYTIVKFTNNGSYTH